MPRPLSFTRAMRLVHKNDFARAFREGRRARGATVVVVVMKNGLAHSRLGLSVGRAIWKSAVKRNRVRRIFREAFRLSYPDLPPGVDVILIPAAPKLVPDLAQTRAELVPLVERALARFSEPRPPAPRAAPKTDGSARSTGAPTHRTDRRPAPGANPCGSQRSVEPPPRAGRSRGESSGLAAANPEGPIGARDVEPPGGELWRTSRADGHARIQR